MVNHGTQTFKIPSGSKPAARSVGSRCGTAANQNAAGNRWPPSDAPHASLLLERIRQTTTSAGDADTLVTSDNPVANLGTYSAPAVDDVEFVQRTVPVVNALAHGTISLLDVEAPEGCSYHLYWT
ncbi:hypothetical protein JTB14_004832 [Gonioctena quinquepunctata]|nr:hypothetical protein JTB14_004832 [Gonioctena quinquepunctata]